MYTHLHFCFLFLRYLSCFQTGYFFISLKWGIPLISLIIRNIFIFPWLLGSLRTQICCNMFTILCFLIVLKLNSAKSVKQHFWVYKSTMIYLSCRLRGEARSPEYNSEQVGFSVKLLWWTQYIKLGYMPAATGFALFLRAI